RGEGRDPGGERDRPRRRRRAPVADRSAGRGRTGPGGVVRSGDPAGGAAVFVRDHRPAEGGDAHASQPGGECVSDQPADGHRRRRQAAGGAAVLPYLRDDGAAERGPVQPGELGDDAEVRPGRVPVDR
ncbi:4-coumarate CoA ligase, partial [Rhodococcus opacus PD630]